MSVDYNGVAILVGAIAAAVPIIGGFTLQVISYMDQRHIKMAQQQQEIDATRRERKIDELAVKVNGVTDKAVELAYRTGVAESGGTMTGQKLP